MILRNQHLQAPRAGGTATIHVEGEDWRTHPARGCANLNPNLFFSPISADRNAALKACRNCPFRTNCDEYATANGEKFGIWGGRNRTSGAQTEEHEDADTDEPAEVMLTDEQLIDLVLTDAPGRFKHLNDRLQRLAILEGFDRGFTLGRLSRKFCEKVVNLHQIAYGKSLGMRVAELLAQGMHNTEIAATIGIGISLVGETRSAYGLTAAGWRKAVAA